MPASILDTYLSWMSPTFCYLYHRKGRRSVSRDTGAAAADDDEQLIDLNFHAVWRRRFSTQWRDAKVNGRHDHGPRCRMV